MLDNLHACADDVMTKQLALTSEMSCNGTGLERLVFGAERELRRSHHPVVGQPQRAGSMAVGRQGATSDNSLRMKQIPFKCCCNNHAA
jgi:hypothetical protein